MNNTKNEDKVLIVGAVIAGLTATGGFLTGQPGTYGIVAVVILAVANALKGLLN